MSARFSKPILHVTRYSELTWVMSLFPSATTQLCPSSRSGWARRITFNTALALGLDFERERRHPCLHTSPKNLLRNKQARMPALPARCAGKDACAPSTVCRQGCLRSHRGRDGRATFEVTYGCSATPKVPEVFFSACRLPASKKRSPKYVTAA